jgi:hypothetical protein
MRIEKSWSMWGFMALGHGNCGAVEATIAAKAVPGQISSLYSYLRPAVNQANGDLDAAVAANARMQALILRESSAGVAGLVKERQDQGGGPLSMTSVAARVNLLDCRRHVSPPNGSGRFIDARGHAVARPTLT